MYRMTVMILSVALAAAPAIGAAQTKDQVRNQGKEFAAKYRALGEPRDRCSLGSSLATGSVVIRTNGASALRPGDKLLSLNGTSTVGKTPEEVVGILRQTPPTAVLAASVERDGHPMDVSVACINARLTTEPTLTALEFAARGKFDECVSTISQMAYIDTSVATLRAQCAAVSRNSAKYNMSALGAQLLEMGIEDARYAPSLRADVVQRLHNAEGGITQGQGAARYQALVEATKRGPGDESLYASAAPDWALFRRNAESTLRNRLIDPDSARIQWPQGFTMGTWKPFMSKSIEGYWTCGLINARNRMGGYTGSTAFVVVIDPSGYVKYSEIGKSKDYDFLTASCSKSVKMLPPPPPELTALASAPSNVGVVSLADELKKLVDLRSSGALTEAEFQAAKAKLLESSEH